MHCLQYIQDVNAHNATSHYATGHQIALPYIQAFHTYIHTYIAMHALHELPTYMCLHYIHQTLNTYITFIHTYIHACIHACIHDIHTRIASHYIHADIHTYKPACIHTRMQ